MKIVPAILTADKGDFDRRIAELEQILRVEGTNLFDTAHIDIVDSSFSDDESLSVEVLEDLTSDFLIDVHLMVDDPVSLVEKVLDGMADRVIGQVEHMSSQQEFVERVLEADLRVGLALDLETSVEALDREVLKKVDTVLLMAVPAGHGGQVLDQDVFKKGEKLRDLREELGLKFSLCLDGGVHADNIEEIKKAGINEVAIGSGVFEGDVLQNLRILKEKINA